MGSDTGAMPRINGNSSVLDSFISHAVSMCLQMVAYENFGSSTAWRSPSEAVFTLQILSRARRHQHLDKCRRVTWQGPV